MKNLTRRPTTFFCDLAANKENLQLPEAWTLQVGVIQGQWFAQVIPRDLQVVPPFAKGVPVYVLDVLNLAQMKSSFVDSWTLGALPSLIKQSVQHMTYESSDMVELTVFSMPTQELQKMVIEHGGKMFKAKPVILTPRRC